MGIEMATWALIIFASGKEPELSMFKNSAECFKAAELVQLLAEDKSAKCFMMVEQKDDTEQ